MAGFTGYAHPFLADPHTSTTSDLPIQLYELTRDSLSKIKPSVGPMLYSSG